MTVQEHPTTESPFVYSPAPESAAVARIAPSYGLFIDGAHRAAADGRTLTTINPATEAVLSTVAHAGAADIDAAVRAARAAFEGLY